MPFKRPTIRPIIPTPAISRLSPMTNVGGEIARALPDSKGGEIPKDLQRWRTDASELFTTTLGESVLFYSADQWMKLKLTLETAGPVSIGIGRSDILPVLSGKGRLLTTDQEWEVYIPKGARAYYAAENVNRVALTVEPIPWMEQLSMEIGRVAAAVMAGARAIISAVAGKPVDQAGTPPTLPPSLQRDTKLQRLTKMDPPGKL